MTKKLFFLLSFLILISVNTKIYAKYVIEYTMTVANVQIVSASSTNTNIEEEKSKPKVQITKVIKETI